MRLTRSAIGVEMESTVMCAAERSLRKLIAFEQRNLWKPDRFRRGGDDSQFDIRYLPESREIFRLPSFWLKRRHLYVYGRKEEGEILPGVGHGCGLDGQMLFPVHPVELERYLQFFEHVEAKDSTSDGVDLLATPTSSVRTLLVWRNGHPEAAVFIKFSLCTRMLGDRRLRRQTVARSIGLSRLVEESENVLPPGMNYFHENLGLIPRLLPDSGVIIRTIPRRILDDSAVVAPLFALMGGQSKNQPLLLNLFEVGQSAVALLVDALFEKFARIWVELVFSFGLILEAHAQDLLLLFSQDMVPAGEFYYRDFEGLTVDWHLRRSKGLRDTEMLPNAYDWFQTYNTWGYPRAQLVSRKMWISLYDYLYLFLGELEGAVREWEACGVRIEPPFGRDSLGNTFLRYLRKVIHEKFGLRESERYDAVQNLHRFVKFLMEVRKGVMSDVSE